MNKDEQCLSWCRSPLACSAFGYCRQLNFPPCENCGSPLAWTHDHKPDNSGLDDGPPLDPPRKKAVPKSAEETAGIRARAWATRREKYGQYGHR